MKHRLARRETIPTEFLHPKRKEKGNWRKKNKETSSRFYETTFALEEVEEASSTGDIDLIKQSAFVIFHAE